MDKARASARASRRKGSSEAPSTPDTTRGLLATPLGPDFRIKKATGTHADVLAAVGLADLIHAMGLSPVRIVDAGTAFIVSAPEPVTSDHIEKLPHDAGYPYLCPNEKARALVPKGVTPVDYSSEKEKEQRYFKAREALRRAGKSGTDLASALAQDQPRPDWPLLKALNGLQGDDGTNRVFARFYTMEPAEMRGIVATGLAAIAAGRPSELEIGASTVQIFAPTFAKGYARMKPSGTSRNDKTIESWSDHALEWLRYRGYFRCVCPRMLSKDVRLLVPIPSDVTLDALQALTTRIKEQVFAKSRPKVDVLATLRFAELLVRHSEEYHAPEDEPFPGLRLQGRSPATIISGIFATHYQNMGSAKAVMGMMIVALPGWFSIRSKKDAEEWIAILREHYSAIHTLEDRNSDQTGLVLAYRSFLQTRGEVALAAFLDFVARYGAFSMRASTAKRRRWSFRTDHFRRVLMGTNPTLSTILDDPGFVAVAAAVRNATVTAQALKANKVPDYREVRYGLLDEIRRARDLPGTAFVERVCGFVSKYNAENAKRRESGRIAQANVTINALQSFLRLVEVHGAPIVGALLAAYGSCRIPKDREAERALVAGVDAIDENQEGIDTDDSEPETTDDTDDESTTNE